MAQFKVKISIYSPTSNTTIEDGMTELLSQITPQPYNYDIEENNLRLFFNLEAENRVEVLKKAVDLRNKLVRSCKYELNSQFFEPIEIQDRAEK